MQCSLSGTRELLRGIIYVVVLALQVLMVTLSITNVSLITLSTDGIKSALLLVNGNYVVFDTSVTCQNKRETHIFFIHSDS